MLERLGTIIKKALHTLSEVIYGMTIYDWVHKEQIPHIKLGNLLRFDRNDIERWINTLKQKPRAKW